MLSLRHLLVLVITCILASRTVAESTSSPHDLFRAIALQVPKRTEPPICCLKAQSQLETPDDEILLSFEEWKAKKLQALQADTRHLDHDNSSNPAAVTDSEGTIQNTSMVHQEGTSPTSQTNEELASIQSTESILPHFQVPTTDRFNYANLDCSARVHIAHRSAKSASSILSSKKDRYMLSPCKTKENQFIVVELCDDIRIDTVQLANYEFFSGVFKDFSVSVAKTYTDSEGWTHAGTYRAKNVRGVQSFRFPDTLRDFYRYIRIDFHSHYGNEYYCPVSLVRVYGLTHLEEWKWNIWMAESRAKQAEALKVKQLGISSPLTSDSVESTVLEGTTTPAIDPIIAQTLANLSNQAASLTKAALDNLHPSSDDLLVPSVTVPPNGSALRAATDVTLPHDPSQPSDAQPQDTISSPNSLATLPSVSSSSTSTPGSGSSLTSTTSSSSATSVPISSGDDTTGPRSAPHSSSPSHKTSSQNASPPVIISSSATTAIPSVATGPLLSSGGESIYGLIMNKLVALETNHTLYTLYMEQQNSAIREMIKRLGENIGRLEAVTRAQRANSQKMLVEWEKQRVQILVDYAQLASRVEHLSEEILLEKRLGVAQLCLMLAVLVFMGLTRGSRGESVVVTGHNSMREWGRRHLSLSGDWTTRFKRKSSLTRRNNRSRPPVVNSSTSPKHSSPLPGDEKIEFPRKCEPDRKEPLAPIHLNTSFTPSRIKKLSQTRSRTPSLRATVAAKRAQQMSHNRPVTPTALKSHLRPQVLQRSSSHGPQTSMDRTNRSVKKWARTAHLHPVKSPAFPKVNSDENDFPAHGDMRPSGGLGLGDVFSRSLVDSFDFPRGTKDREHSYSQPAGRVTPDDDAESNWIDSDGNSEYDFQDM